MPNRSKKREVELVVISDVHLGTHGCHAKELLQYVRSIDPKTVILNGDIIDIWQFKKHYWPKSHMKIIKHIISWITNDITMYYITGNHDEMLRKFSGFNMNSFHIVNKVVLKFGDKAAWFFHGDVFDVTMQHSKWLTKLGAVGYDFLIQLNLFVNAISQFFGKGRISLSKKIKNSVKGAVKYINGFEQVAADIAIENGYDYVVCGHIHQPKIKTYKNSLGETTYLNSGDWVENLTALEFNGECWEIYTYDESDYVDKDDESILTDDLDRSDKEIFNAILNDFKLMKSS